MSALRPKPPDPKPKAPYTASWQMDWEVLVGLDVDRLGRLAPLVAIHLRHQADAETGIAWCTQEMLAALCSATPRGVRGAIKRMIAHGYLAVRRHHRAQANRYQLLYSGSPPTGRSLPLAERRQETLRRKAAERNGKPEDRSPGASLKGLSAPLTSLSSSPILNSFAGEHARADEPRSPAEAEAPEPCEGPADPTPALPASPLRLGEEVRHERHGEGTVVAVLADRVEVAWQRGGRSHATRAYLERLEPTQ